MPLILDGASRNKPLANARTLNAMHDGMHVWLQNHWTGTPDNSASTLSDDHETMATNLLISPKALNRFDARWGLREHMSLLTDDNGDTYLHIDGKGNSTYVIYFPGEAYPLPYMGCVQARSNAQWVSIRIGRTTDLALTPDESWHSFAQQENSANGWADSGLLVGTERFLQSDQYLDFKLPALFSPSDFQGMRNHGVTWFDGDSYVRGGV